MRRDIRYQEAIGPARYEDERAALHARIQELQEELNICNKRLSKLDEPTVRFLISPFICVLLYAC